MNNKFTLYFIIFFSFFINFNCINFFSNIQEKESTVNEFIYTTLKDWYLWYDKIPDIDYEKYKNPEDLLDNIIYKKYDRYSFLIKITENIKDLTEDETFAFGFLLKWTDNTTDSTNKKKDLRICFVYPDSPAATKNLKRGDKISKINNYVIPQEPVTSDSDIINNELDKDNITIYLNNDLNKGINLSKSVFKIEPILNSKKIYDVTTDNGNIKVGYLFFQSFIGIAKSKLNEVFNSFKEQNISELILDLRYNPGGRVDVANHLCNLIAGLNNDKKLFYNIKLNNRFVKNHTLWRFNDTYANYYFKTEENSINLKRIFIITSGKSASASELVINGLKPYIDVILIGKKSYGKPVGMLGLQYSNYLLYAINFAGYNSKGEGDFYDGIPVNNEITEDLFINIGDIKELCLKESINCIKNPQLIKTTLNKIEKQINMTDFNYELPLKKLNSIFGCY